MPEVAEISAAVAHETLPGAIFEGNGGIERLSDLVPALQPMGYPHTEAPE